MAVKIAFMILSGDADRAGPGLTMAYRMKTNRNADIRVLFFGPGVKLAAGGQVDHEIKQLEGAGVIPRACVHNAETFGVDGQIRELGIELTRASGDIASFHEEGFTVLSF